MTDFAIDYSYYPELEGIIRSGQRVDDHFLKEALEWHQGRDHPDFLTDYLERLRRGEFPRKVGRPKSPPGHQASLLLYKQCYYTGFRTWLTARREKYGHITGLGYRRRDQPLRHYAPNELAAMKTAKIFLGDKNRWRTLQNQLSKKPRFRI